MSELKVIGVMVVSVAILGGLLFYGAFSFHMISCRDTAHVMNVPYRFSNVTGCMIKPAGKDWLPLRSYRVVD